MTVDTTTSLELVCTQENLSRGLQAVSRIATTKSSLPILANIHLSAEQGTVKLAATDLEIGVTTTIGAKVKHTGSITLPARLLVDFVSNNTDQTISLTLDKVDAHLQSERYQAVIKGIDAGEFPLIPEPGEEETATIGAAQLKLALQDVQFAAAMDDARPVLNGVLLKFAPQSLTVAATDSYRLAERSVPLPKRAGRAAQVILPNRSALELIRLLPADPDQVVTLSLTTSQLSLEFGSTQVVSRLVEGTYPDYQQIIPTQATTQAQCRRADLLAAVRMSSLFARDVAHHIRLRLDPTGAPSFIIQAMSSSVGTNTAQVGAEVEGAALEVAFNAKFLADAIGATQGEVITLKLQAPDRPIVVVAPDQTEYLNLVMPLRLDA